jgi:hypothetical protein
MGKTRTYKKGDRVRIVRDASYHRFTKGAVVEIDEVHSNGPNQYYSAVGQFGAGTTWGGFGRRYFDEADVVPASRWKQFMNWLSDHGIG